MAADQALRTIGLTDKLSYPCEAVTRAFSLNPRLAWTPQGLAMWYGLRFTDVQDALALLMARGLLRPSSASGRDELGAPITSLAWTGDQGEGSIGKPLVPSRVA